MCLLGKHPILCACAVNLGLHPKQACHLIPMPQVEWPIIRWPDGLRINGLAMGFAGKK